MEKKTFEQVKAALEDLNRDFARPKISPLAFSDLIDIKDATLAWPNAKSAGVYALFDENKLLLYVGKASCNTTLGYRLGKHFDRLGAPRLGGAFDAVRFAATVPLPSGHGFEAPAVEEFLITRLNPELCVVARTEWDKDEVVPLL